MQVESLFLESSDSHLMQGEQVVDYTYTLRTVRMRFYNLSLHKTPILILFFIYLDSFPTDFKRNYDRKEVLSS